MQSVHEQTANKHLLSSNTLPLNLSFQKPVTELSEPSFLSSTDKSFLDYPTQAALNSTIASKISKEEYLAINQSGAVEIILTRLNSAVLRKLSWALTSLEIQTTSTILIDEEKHQYIEEINALLYDKHSLLEDNNSLRLHNEALIDSLEKTNDDCYLLSNMLNDMKIRRMVNVISRSVDSPILEALWCLRHNKVIFNRYGG
jgi:hypothetical protein